MSKIERRTFLGVVALSPLAKFFGAFRPAVAPPEPTILGLEFTESTGFSVEAPGYRLQYRAISEFGKTPPDWRDIDEIRTEPARGGSLPVRGRDGDLELSFEVTFADDLGTDRLEPGGYEFRVLDPEEDL